MLPLKKLEALDGLLRSLLASILNIDLNHDGSWLQATLPVHAGGLGVRRAVQLAPSAFLASAAGCSSLLIREIFPPCIHACVDPHIDLALIAWKQSHTEPPPSLPESSHQRVWDAPLIAATITSLLDGASQQATVRLLAVATPELGAWLNALPISSLGLKVDDDVVRIAVGLRLGVAICHPHKCCSCGADVESLAGFYLENIFGGEARFKGCLSSPKRWVREGDVPPPARSAKAEPFLITNKLKL